MAEELTPNLGLTKPEVGASTNTWGGTLNNNLDEIDLLFDATEVAGGHQHSGVAGDGPPLVPASLEGLTTVGLVAVPSAGTFVERAIQGGAGIQVGNGDGVAGNPSVAVNINGLTVEPTLDREADYVMVHDASVDGLRKTLLRDLPLPDFAELDWDIDTAELDGTTVTVDLANAAIHVIPSGDIDDVDFLNRPDGGGVFFLYIYLISSLHSLNWGAAPVKFPGGDGPFTLGGASYGWAAYLLVDFGQSDMFGMKLGSNTNEQL